MQGLAIAEATATGTGKRMADYAEIVEALRAKWEDLGEPLEVRHRLRRCISWIERAGAANDKDAKCIFLCIAFNAAYAIERKAARAQWEGETPKEWQLQRRFFEKLMGVEFLRIHRTIRNDLWNAVDRLMKQRIRVLGILGLPHQRTVRLAQLAPEETIRGRASRGQRTASQRTA